MVNPAVDDDPATYVRAVISDVSDTVATTVDLVVEPQAAAAVATTFTFPLVLMVLVVLFLVVQPRVDRMDPKLRAAADNAAGAVLVFHDEESL